MAREGYRDSGVEWIGEVPEGWEVSKLGFFTSLKFGFPFPSEKFNNDIGHPVVKIGDVLTGAAASLVDYDWIDAAAVDDGEILLGMSGDFNVAYWHGGKALLNQRTCAISSASVKLKNEYLFYLLGQALYEQNMTTQASIIKNLGAGQIRSIRFPLPPLTEQVRIAEYLDRETGKLDALISELTEFSKILKARTKSLIAECVTKGLPGSRDNRAMRDSGIEWIGMVPEEWEVATFGRVIENDNAGEVIPKDFWDQGDELLYTCQITPMKSNYRGFEDRRRTLEGDLLLTRNGTPYIFIPEIHSIYSNVVQRVSLHKNMITTYFAKYALDCAGLSMQGKGNTIASFNMGIWRALSIPLPPLTEQVRIAEYLDSEVAKSNALLASVASLIEDLRTYRKALISEVVTGKRRV